MSGPQGDLWCSLAVFAPCGRAQGWLCPGNTGSSPGQGDGQSCAGSSLSASVWERGWAAQPFSGAMAWPTLKQETRLWDWCHQEQSLMRVPSSPVQTLILLP